MATLEVLRESLVPLLSEGTWSVISETHKKVELGWREDLNPGSGKPRYTRAVLVDLDDQEIMALAKRCIERLSKEATVGLQNTLWAYEAKGSIAISEITRISLAKMLDGHVMHPRAKDDPHAFLKRFAVPVEPENDIRIVAYGSDHFLYWDPSSLQVLKGIEIAFGVSKDHNWKRYSHLQLLDTYGFRTWPDKRVFQLLATLVTPTARTGQEQIDWVTSINEIIRADGFHLRETKRISGHPDFRVRPLQQGVDGRPKNLIFASSGPKPVLGFCDAINNDIVVLENGQYCLVYEDRIPESGLTWEDLVGWWAKANDEAQATSRTRDDLEKRLMSSMTSAPERLLFTTYLREFQPRLEKRLPALVPQVYLHYDPVTIQQLRERKQEKRFLVQRMDFLLLLSAGVRVVLEIDGQQHYSEGQKGAERPSPRLYAETTRADRELRLLGYEVYRFGGYELFRERDAITLITNFFQRLFRRHGVLK